MKKNKSSTHRTHDDQLHKNLREGRTLPPHAWSHWSSPSRGRHKSRVYSADMCRCPTDCTTNSETSRCQSVDMMPDARTGHLRTATCHMRSTGRDGLRGPKPRARTRCSTHRPADTSSNGLSDTFWNGTPTLHKSRTRIPPSQALHRYHETDRVVRELNTL